MKSFVSLLIAFSCYCLLQSFCVAGTAKESNKEIISTISFAVQEQVKKQSPQERNKVEAAIRVGNKYAPHHFDGTAYARNDELEEKMWQKNIRPLVTLQADKGNGGWYLPGEVHADSAPEREINGIKVSFDVVCPQPELISAKYVNDHVELTYHTRIIGMWRSTLKRGDMTLDDSIQDDLILDKKEEYAVVLIAVDKSNRVSRVVAQYDEYSTIPENGINTFESYIKWPPMRLYQGREHVEQETEEQARARIPRYKQYIEMIKNVEAVTCGGASGNTKQHQGWE